MRERFRGRSDGAIAPDNPLISLGVAVNLLHPVTAGIALSLVAGKAVGVFGATWLMVRLGWAAQPAQANWQQVLGVSLLAGIGFTLSLFIGALAFEGQDPGYEARVKLGVMCDSLVAATLGAAVLAAAARTKPPIRGAPAAE